MVNLDNYCYRHRPDPAPRLLWMRTFEDIYNPEMAVEVLAQLLPIFPDATLTMAGQPKGTLDKVKALAADKGLADRIRFAGFLDMAGKQREFANHDIFLNTNRVDNMPVSVVEAAAFGLPIVATAVGGIPHLLEHEQTVLLVPDEDSEAMAQAVTRLLQEPGLAAQLSSQGRKLAEASDWPRIHAQWQNLFSTLGS
ncbi:MAG: glycosyltransferase family 4 protein [Anaerolineales bacterium]|nr:glycosyltransferase family 4 protein [Anaerolineales bacterium]